MAGTALGKLPPTAHVLALSEYSLRLGSQTGGQTFWVDSSDSRASDSNTGTRETPFATIDEAIGHCVANRGDVILVKPGHVEVITAAGGVTCDVDGVTIRGIPIGRKLPKVQVGTATSATFLISADNVLVEGLWFECDKATDDLVTLVNITSAAWVTIRNCYFSEGDAATKNPLACIILNDAAADFCTIENNVFYSPNTGCNHAIAIDAVVDSVTIAHNVIQGSFADACIHSGSAHTNYHIHHNTFRNTVASAHAVEFTAAATGMIEHNTARTQVAAGGAADVFDIGSGGSNNNLAADTDADTSGKLTPPAT